MLNTKCSLDNNSLFKISSGYIGKILNQIVLGLSPLKAHLFLYNIIDNPFCPCCLEEVEDPAHYFLKCRSHSDYRNSMMLELNKFCKYKNLVVNKDSDILNLLLNNFEYYYLDILHNCY